MVLCLCHGLCLSNHSCHTCQRVRLHVLCEFLCVLVRVCVCVFVCVCVWFTRSLLFGRPSKTRNTKTSDFRKISRSRFNKVNSMCPSFLVPVQLEGMYSVVLSALQRSTCWPPAGNNFDKYSAFAACHDHDHDSGGGGDNFDDDCDDRNETMMTTTMTMTMFIVGCQV